GGVGHAATGRHLLFGQVRHAAHRRQRQDRRRHANHLHENSPGVRVAKSVAVMYAPERSAAGLNPYTSTVRAGANTRNLELETWNLELESDARTPSRYYRAV